MPATPPSTDRITASSMNWKVMSARLAPMALRIPISRVRSVTVTNMMFITPIPPTSSEMAAIAPSRTVKIPVIELAALRKVAEFVTEKSRSSAVVRWRASRIASIWVCAASTVSAEVAWTEMLLRLP